MEAMSWNYNTALCKDRKLNNCYKWIEMQSESLSDKV